MTSRFRGLAALIALLALSLFWAEGLWASMCSPDMEMPVASHMADSDTHGPHCPVGHPGHSQDEGKQGSPDPSCPLVPPGVTSCTGGVALLPSSADSVLSPYEDAIAIASSDHAKDLLLAVSLLRPPKA